MGANGTFVATFGDRDFEREYIRVLTVQFLTVVKFDKMFPFLV